MPILPSVGAQTGNRLAQMVAAQGQQQFGAALDTRRMAIQQQLATSQEQERKRMLLMALLQKHSSERQAKRAARGPGQMSRTFQTLFAGTPVNAFLESDRTVSSGYQPNKDNSIVGFIDWLMNMRSGGLKNQMGQQSLGQGTTDSSDY